MEKPCTEVRAACAHTFREVLVSSAKLGERLEAIDRRLEGVAKAVVGNGSTRDSLVARVERLESAAVTQARCADRFWKVLAVAASLASVGVALLR